MHSGMSTLVLQHTPEEDCAHQEKLALTTLLGLQMMGLLSSTMPLFLPSSMSDSKQITPCKLISPVSVKTIVADPIRSLMLYVIELPSSRD